MGNISPKVTAGTLAAAITTLAVYLASLAGVDIPEVDAQLLLDVARDAAHAVDRPAAPITTFLLGYAVAKAGDDKLSEAAHGLMRLSGEWDLGLHRG